MGVCEHIWLVTVSMCVCACVPLFTVWALVCVYKSAGPILTSQPPSGQHAVLWYAHSNTHHLTLAASSFTFSSFYWSEWSEILYYWMRGGQLSRDWSTFPFRIFDIHSRISCTQLLVLFLSLFQSYTLRKNTVVLWIIACTSSPVVGHTATLTKVWKWQVKVITAGSHLPSVLVNITQRHTLTAIHY